MDLFEDCSLCGKKHRIEILEDEFGRFRIGLNCNSKHDYLSGVMSTYEDALSELEAIDFYYEKFDYEDE